MRESAEPDLRDIVFVIRLVIGLTRSVECACRKGGLSVAQYRVLAALEEGATRAGDLALRIGVTPSTVTALAARLEQSRFLERHEVAGDGRGVELVATQAGEAARERAERGMCEALLELTEQAGLERTIARRHAFVRAFRRLSARARPAAPLRPPV
jgi:DNA-binding MarR family transcriptional regulator